MSGTNNSRLLTCYHCGNKGLLKVEHFHNYTFGGPVFDEYGEVRDYEPVEKYNWSLLSCPVCHKVTLYEDCFDEAYGVDFNNYLYPKISAKSFYIPANVNSAYEAALKVKNIDLAVCLLALRRVLEAVCKDNNAKGNNLYEMIQDMIKRKVLPEMFDDACWVIKELGNSAAHADNKTYYLGEVEQTFEFMETIIDYLYVLPQKMKSMRKSIEAEYEKCE